MKSNYNTRATAIMPYTMLEAVGAIHGRQNSKSKIINSIVKSPGWFSRHCEFRWKLRRAKSGRYYIQLGINVQRAIGGRPLLPTPVASDGTGGSNRKLTLIEGKPVNISNKGVRYGLTIRQLAEEGLLPTPTARLAKVRCDTDRGKGNLQDSLSRLIKPATQSPKINPGFISEMMGFPVRWLREPFQGK